MNENDQKYFNDLLVKYLDSIIVKPERVVYPYTWVGHISFASFLVTILKPESFVELGTHTGNSYNAICQAVKTNKLKTKCYSIDTWEGDEHAGFYSAKIFEKLKEYQDKKYSEFSTLMRCYFDEAVREFADNSIDVLHIDGLHTYEAVKHDFETWMPKLSDKAVVLFHDTVVHERNFGVYKLWEEIKGSYPSLEFQHSHGLGVLCVGKNISKEFIELIDYANDESNAKYVKEFFSKIGLINLDGPSFLYQTELLGYDKVFQEISSDLFVDNGEGFNENDKLNEYSEVYNNFCEIKFDLSRFEKCKSVRFDLGHELIIIKDLTAEVCVKEDCVNKIKINPEKTNAIHHDNGLYYFSNTPQIYYSFESISQTKECISLRFEVLSKGMAALPLVAGKIDEMKYKLDSALNYVDVLIAEKETISKEYEVIYHEKERLADENRRLNELSKR